MVLFGSHIFSKRFDYLSVEPDLLINKDIINPEFFIPHISFLSTPGHSEGSVSMVINKEVTLVGDAAFGVFRNSVFPPFADDIPEMIRSWEKLLKTGCRLFLSGHGGEISRELLQKEHDKYFKKYRIN